MPSIIDERREQEAPPPASWTRRPLDQLYEIPRRRRSRAAIWLAIALLAGAGAFAYFNTYQRLQNQSGALSKLTSLPGLFDVLINRVSTVETKLSGIPAEIDTLRQRMGGVDERMLNGLALARQNTQTAGAALRKDMLAATARQSATEARVSQLENAQRAEAARTTVLEQELARQHAQLRQQVTELNGRLAAAGEQARAGEQRLRQQIEQTGRRVSATVTQEVTSFQNRPRERFEVARGQSLEVAPGIVLHVTRTNTSHRRFDGWLHLVRTGKILWLRDESALRSVAFYAGTGDLRHDLVITNLDRDGVTGYVIFPSRGETAAGGS